MDSDREQAPRDLFQESCGRGDPTAVVLYSTLYEKKSFFVAAWVKTFDKEKKGKSFFLKSSNIGTDIRVATSTSSSASAVEVVLRRTVISAARRVFDTHVPDRHPRRRDRRADGLGVGADGGDVDADGLDAGESFFFRRE